jgi:hypothetical protein
MFTQGGDGQLTWSDRYHTHRSRLPVLGSVIFKSTFVL